MSVGALYLPDSIIRCHAGLPLSDLLQPLDRDVQIPGSAKLGVQPFQFAFQSNPSGIDNHRRKKRNGGPQAGQRNAHFVQGCVIADARRFVISSQIFQAAARDNSKGRVACHPCIQPRFRAAVLLPLPCGMHGNSACGIRG
jgi:hypothetical protein